MVEKNCVGAILYDSVGRIFLNTSYKWGDGKLWIVPGGKIETFESKEDALIREITEELGIDISNIVKMCEKKVVPEGFYKKDVTFNFTDYYAKAESTFVKPNKEIGSYGWFNVRDSLWLPTPTPIREMILNYAKIQKINVGPLDKKIEGYY